MRRKNSAIVRRAGRALPRLLCPGEGKCGADFFARKPREQHLLRVILLRNRSVDERDLGSHGDDPAVESHLEEFADGFAAVFAVVQGALVDVHADKLIGQRGIEIAGELHGVS